MPNQSQVFVQDPNDYLDYLLDFLAYTHGTGASDWLLPGETIVFQTTTADGGINTDGGTIINAGTTVQVWVGGGVDGLSYNVTVHIITNQGRELDRTLVFEIIESGSTSPSSPPVFYPVGMFPRSAISLARYAELILYDEPAFWGVQYTNQSENVCSTLWSERNRQMIAQYLSEAQQEIEQYVGYFLQRTYVNGILDDTFFFEPRFVDEQIYAPCVMLTRYAHLIEFGKRVLTNIRLLADVYHTTDPARVGPIAATINHIEEVRVYLPGTDREVTPSKIIYEGGNLFLEIPRSRLVKASLLWSASGVDYEDVGNFECNVDIKREYTDTTQQVNLVGNHSCNSFCSSNGCTEYSNTGCGYIRDHKLGIVQISPASYNVDSSSWVTTSCARGNIARLSYLSGLRSISPQVESAIVRLAHAKMPDEPCGCEVTQKLWMRDREVPRQMTRSRANCPFGMSDGAWTAFKFAQTHKIYRGGVSMLV